MKEFKRTLVISTALCALSVTLSSALFSKAQAFMPKDDYSSYQGRSAQSQRVSDYYRQQQAGPRAAKNKRCVIGPNGSMSYPENDPMAFQFPGMQPGQVPNGYMSPYPPNTAMEFTQTMAQYPVLERDYSYPIPQDEQPVFRPYNTFETDRGMRFDRSPSYQAQPYPPQQPQRAPRYTPVPEQAFDGYYEYEEAPIPDQDFRSQAPQAASNNHSGFSASRYYGGDERYRESYNERLRQERAGYQAPPPEEYLPEPQDNYRAADFYRQQMYEQAPQGYPPQSYAPQGYPQQQARRPYNPNGAFQQYDRINDPYGATNAPDFAPSYPGGAGAYDAPPNYPPQQFNPAYSGGQYGGRYPYAPPVRADFRSAPRLSNKTLDILNKLPHNKRKKPEPIRRYGIDRFAGDVANELNQKSEDYDRGMAVDNAPPRYDSDVELENAYEALMAGQSQQAISIYQGIVKKDSRNQDALFGLATTYHRMGDLQQALPYYGKLLRINPENREALNNFLVLVSEESEVEALRELERLERKNPDFSPIPAQLAIIYDSLGQPSMARKKMVRALRLEPDNIVYKYNLAIMLDKHGKSEDAAVLYKELLAASRKGKSLPASPDNIEERLRYISSEGS